MKFRKQLGIIIPFHVIGVFCLAVIIFLLPKPPFSESEQEQIREIIILYVLSIGAACISIFLPAFTGGFHWIEISERGIIEYIPNGKREIINIPWSEFKNINITDSGRTTYIVAVSINADVIMFERTKKREKCILQYYPEIPLKNVWDVMPGKKTKSK